MANFQQASKSISRSLKCVTDELEEPEPDDDDDDDDDDESEAFALGCVLAGNMLKKNKEPVWASQILLVSLMLSQAKQSGSSQDRY